MSGGLCIFFSGEEVLLEFVEKVKTTKETGQKAEAMWADFSSRWFSLMHSTRPMRLHDVNELADHVSKVTIIYLFLCVVCQYTEVI